MVEEKTDTSCTSDWYIEFGGVEMFREEIDEGATVRAAKKVLEEYADLVKISNKSCYDINVKSRSYIAPLFSDSYVNSDANLVDVIERKNKKYERLKKYIHDIEVDINSLELWQIELINMRYLHNMQTSEIIEKLSQEHKILSERQLRRKFKKCYIDFAISHGIFKIREK